MPQDMVILCKAGSLDAVIELALGFRVTAKQPDKRGHVMLQVRVQAGTTVQAGKVEDLRVPVFRFFMAAGIVPEPVQIVCHCGGFQGKAFLLQSPAHGP